MPANYFLDTLFKRDRESLSFANYLKGSKRASFTRVRSLRSRAIGGGR